MKSAGLLLQSTLPKLCITALLLCSVTASAVIKSRATCPYNLSIKHWAALGDSFASGTDAYPSLLSKDQCFHNVQPSNEVYIGATVTSVKNNQLPRFGWDNDLVTITAGSNDIGLIKILDACIYNFGGVDAPDCSNVLNDTATYMSGTAFANNWAALLSSLESKMSSAGKILVTGTAAFFDETTSDCSKKSLGIFPGKGLYMIPGLRANLNLLVHRLNWWQHYFVTVYNRANPTKSQAEFLDFDDRYNGQRFCRIGDNGILPGDKFSWFESGGDDTKTTDISAYRNMDTSPCEAAISAATDLGLYAKCQIALAAKNDKSLKLTNFATNELPTSWDQVFHPNANGQVAIKDEIMSQLALGPTLSGFDLRIMPLGGSITAGSGSTDGLGWRKTLRDTLIKTNTLDYVGSQGTPPLLHEGHPGWIISDISNAASLSLSSRPNVVLIHAGTNDILDNDDIPNAPARVGALIDHVYKVCADALIIVSQILPCGRPGVFDQFVDFNAGVASILNQKQVEGLKVMKAWMPITLDDLGPDHIHPTDAGYVKMAGAWVKALQRAADKGWIGKPVNV